MRNSRTMRLRLMCGTGALALWGGAAAAAEPVEIEAVTVTAQKRTQDTLDVGLNVAVVGAQELADRRVSQVSDLVAFTPNVDIKENMPGVLPVVTIRGVGLNDFSATNNPSAGVYVDEVYLSSLALMNFDLFDLERMEALKGPQGTLYGRNSTAGAINIVTAKPSFGGVEGRLAAGYSAYRTAEIEGMVNLPVSDSFALRFAGKAVKQDEGFFDNRLLGRDIGRREVGLARAQAPLSAGFRPPADSVRIALSAPFRAETAAPGDPAGGGRAAATPGRRRTPGKLTVSRVGRRLRRNIREHNVLVGSQTRRLALGRLAAAGGLLFTAPLAYGQVPEAPAAEPDDEPTSIAITRQLFEHITAPVTINGLGPYRFMVDTGANVSCISAELAGKLALPPGRELQVHTIVGRRGRPSVVLDRLEIGARVRKKVQAPVLPMSSFDIDGVLGIDWLKGQRLVMGFAGNTLEITKSRQEASAKGKVVVPARRKSGQLTIVDADISGRSISAMIDSGSQFSLGNAALKRLIMRLDPTAAQRASHVGLISIAGERFSGEQLYLPFIRLGGLNLGNVPVVFSDMPIFRLWDLHETPTIMIGIDLLTQFETVSVDFGRSAVRFDIASA